MVCSVRSALVSCLCVLRVVVGVGAVEFEGCGFSEVWLEPVSLTP